MKKVCETPTKNEEECFDNSETSIQSVMENENESPSVKTKSAKKYQIFSPIVFYVAFFLINIFNSYILTSGLLHFNISPYNSLAGNFWGFLGDFGVLLLIFSATFLCFKKHRGRCNILLGFSFILTLLIMFLEVFSNMFSMFFAFSQLTSFQNPSQGSLILEYTSYIIKMFGELNILIHIICFVLLVVLRFFINTSYERNILKTPYKFGLFGSSFVFMIIPLVILNVGARDTIQEISMSGLYGSSKAGTYNYYLYSAGETIFKLKPNEATKQERAVLSNFLSKYEKNPEYSNADTGIYEGKNLVILQLEAFNNYALNLTVDGIEITPNLNKLLNESYYNDRFYSTAGIGNTSDCEFSVLTGLYPNGNDLAVFSYTGKNYPSLANDFSKAGYHSFSIHGNDGEFYNRNVQHIQTFHFDEHIDKKAITKRMKSRNEKPEIFGDWISDECLLQESIKIFYEDYYSKGKPFFAYDILVTSHTPFIKNDKIKKLNLTSVTGLAKSCLEYYHYVDKAIGKFFDVLKKDYYSMYQDTVFVMFGDHTSSIMKRDLESITKQKYDDVSYQLRMQNIPLIILDHCGKRVDHKVRGQIDIYPTFANTFALDNPYMIGADIFSNDESLVYSPRTLDLIYDTYVILTASNKIYYLDDHYVVTKAKKENKIADFYHYKYYNDLLMQKNYFK